MTAIKYLKCHQKLMSTYYISKMEEWTQMVQHNALLNLSLLSQGGANARTLPSA